MVYSTTSSASSASSNYSFSVPPHAPTTLGGADADFLQDLRDMVDAEPFNIEPRRILLSAYVEANQTEAARRLACELIDFAGVDDETRALCASILDCGNAYVSSSDSTKSTRPAKGDKRRPSGLLNALRKPSDVPRASKKSVAQDAALNPNDRAAIAALQQDADALCADAEQLRQRGALLKVFHPQDITLTTKLGRLGRLLG